MGICTEQFRCVIGSFNASRQLLYCGKYVSRKGMFGGCVPSFYPFGVIFYLIFMTYFEMFALTLAQV